MWNYPEGVYRRANFDTQNEHQVQILGQFRKIYEIPAFGLFTLMRRTKNLSPLIFYVDFMTE